MEYRLILNGIHNNDQEQSREELISQRSFKLLFPI
uniref:Uncharacterized protein n=1 Tax=Arundo donax TaxID=35708 RepID=A0A0A9CL67_ARUDO